MGRLIVSACTTLDLVIDPLQGWFEPDEDPDGIAQLRAADALILGRKTYEGLAKFWPDSSGGYADLIVVREEFVLSVTHNAEQLPAVAPLLCAGVTMWSPLTHWQAGPGKKIGIVTGSPLPLLVFGPRAGACRPCKPSAS